MKKLIFFILCLLAFFCCQNKPEEEFSCENAQLWDYPVQPKMETWYDVDEYRKSCQIPENILLCLTTKKLTDLCLEYPLLINDMSANSYHHQFDNIFDRFNGIRELYQREDGLNCLTIRYMEYIQSFSILESTNPDVRKGLFLIRFDILEVFLTRFALKKSEVKESQKDVLQALVAGYEERFNYPEFFPNGKPGFGSNSFARANIIIKMEPSFSEQLPEIELYYLLHYGSMWNDETVRILNKFSYQLID